MRRLALNQGTITNQINEYTKSQSNAFLWSYLMVLTDCLIPAKCLGAAVKSNHLADWIIESADDEDD